MNKKLKIVWKTIMLVFSILLVIGYFTEGKYGTSAFWGFIALIHGINIYMI